MTSSQNIPENCMECFYRKDDQCHDPKRWEEPEPDNAVDKKLRENCDKACSQVAAIWNYDL